MSWQEDTFIVILSRRSPDLPWAMRNRCGTLNATLREADKRARLIAEVKAMAQGWIQVEPETSFAVAEITYHDGNRRWTVRRFLTGAPLALPSGDAGDAAAEAEAAGDGEPEAAEALA